ncbi:MAG TPA: response regulator [Pyrinomonadaceae bacterium]|nr:response regulator [Pyrinomonadaceae bacterium]
MSDDSQTNNLTDVSRRILVIEDNFDSAEVLQTFLEIHGHEITVKHNAADGLQAVNQIVPDVVICDISLSDELDGYDVAREIKQNEQLRSIFLIALSGYGRIEDKEQAKSAGFDAHLVKPTDFNELLKLIAQFNYR